MRYISIQAMKLHPTNRGIPKKKKSTWASSPRLLPILMRKYRQATMNGEVASVLIARERIRCLWLLDGLLSIVMLVSCSAKSFSELYNKTVFGRCQSNRYVRVGK